MLDKCSLSLTRSEDTIFFFHIYVDTSLWEEIISIWERKEYLKLRTQQELNITSSGEVLYLNASNITEAIQHSRLFRS
jgi:hypothetical protein